MSSVTSTKKDLEKNDSIEDEDLRIPCPYWLMVFPYIVVYALLTLFSMKFVDTERAQWRFPIFSYIFAGVCFVHFFYILFERWYYFGVAGFYEIYWYCNCGLLMTTIGILLGLPSLIGQVMCLTLFPHLSFWIDSLMYPCFHRSVIGSAGWMFEKSTPWHERLSSLHHFWYFPCIFILFYGQPSLTFPSYYLSIIQFMLLNILSHYMTPKSMIDKTGTYRLLNICVSYVCPDFLTNIPPFKWAGGRPYICHLAIAVLFYNVPFNFIAFVIINSVQYLVGFLFLVCLYRPSSDCL